MDLNKPLMYGFERSSSVVVTIVGFSASDHDSTLFPYTTLFRSKVYDYINRVDKRFRLAIFKGMKMLSPSRSYASPWIDLACA